jgi:hypothetical protein
MIEFAAGIMVGGSVGAVIMGALLAHTRSAVHSVREAAGLQARAHMQVPGHVAIESAQQRAGSNAWSAVLQGRTAFATVSSQLH